MLTSRPFWDGIGGLAYAFAKADKNISQEEMRAFAEKIEKNFRRIPTNFPQRAEAILQLFDNLDYPLEKAYAEALQHLSAVKEEVRHYRFDILDVFRTVIGADGLLHPQEEAFLRRLDEDLARISE